MSSSAVANVQSESTTNKKKKAPPENLIIPPPRPQLTKAERRAIQEQQRAAKAGLSSQNGGKNVAVKALSSISDTNTNVTESKPFKLSTSNKSGTDGMDSIRTNAPISPKNSVEIGVVTNGRAPLTLVSHLTPNKDPSQSFDTGAILRPVSNFNANSPGLISNTTAYMGLHPAVIELGYQFGIGTIRGDNTRCRAMLVCYCTILKDFCNTSNDGTVTSTPVISPNTDWRSTIENSILKPAFTYWTEHCRPHTVSMGNAFTHLKSTLNSLDRDLPLESIVETMLETIAAYVRERIDYAIIAIAEIGCTKLLFRRNKGMTNFHTPSEVILTYGYCEAVESVLSRAITSGKKNFRVIIVDSPPLLEGRILLNSLQRIVTPSNRNDPKESESNVEFTYVHLHAISYVLPSASKVLLGAWALQSDGSVTGRVGTAAVALAARARNIPVIVCAETHKISNRSVPLESLTHNEISSSSGKGFSNERPGEPKRIELLFDLTPASYVSGIITELGIIPPSSVAVILREMNQPQAMTTLF